MKLTDPVRSKEKFLIFASPLIEDAEIAEVVAKNLKLEQALAEANAEDIRIHSAIEFRRGKRTGGQWIAFCPKCHNPAFDHRNGVNGAFPNH